MDKIFFDALTVKKISKPVFEKHVVPIAIKKLYTDVNGTIIGKNTLPGLLQQKTPVYLFGQFDRNGGYNLGQQVISPINWKFLGVFTAGLGVPFLFATGLNDIKNQIISGDIVQIFTDDLDTPNYYQFVIISSGRNSLASIISNSQTDQKDGRFFNLYINDFNFDVDYLPQFNETLHYVNFDNIGNFEENHVQPYIFRTPYNELETFLNIKTPFKVDQYLGIYFYQLFESDRLNLTFNIIRK